MSPNVLWPSSFSRRMARSERPSTVSTRISSRLVIGAEGLRPVLPDALRAPSKACSDYQNRGYVRRVQFRRYRWGVAERARQALPVSILSRYASDVSFCLDAFVQLPPSFVHGVI